MSLTVVLALVNMLPIQPLDGGAALSALLEQLAKRTSDRDTPSLELGSGPDGDTELGGISPRRQSPRYSLSVQEKEKIEDIVSGSVTMLACVVGAGLVLMTLLDWATPAMRHSARPAA